MPHPRKSILGPVCTATDGQWLETSENMSRVMRNLLLACAKTNVKLFFSQMQKAVFLMTCMTLIDTSTFPLYHIYLFYNEDL